jgi:hypothetical protein
MAPTKLDKSEWQPFFDGLSQVLIGKRAEIEVDSLAIGSQIQAEWLPLLGITYDPKDDIIEIALEGVDHLVNKPREVYVDFGVGGLTSLEIIDGEGTQQIVNLRDPLALPPPWKVSPTDSPGGEQRG